MAQPAKQKFKIKKGDQVIVNTGKDKGRTGEVIEVRPSEARVKVQGINMVKRQTPNPDKPWRYRSDGSAYSYFECVADRP